MSLVFLSHRALVFHKTKDAINDKVWLVFSETYFEGVVMTTKAYAVFQIMCSDEELETHQASEVDADAMHLLTGFEFLGSEEIKSKFNSRYRRS